MIRATPDQLLRTRGESQASVYFTDMSGAAKYARTNTFGYYVVTDLSAGDS